MHGPLRRVAIDDDAAAYISDGPELTQADDGSCDYGSDQDDAEAQRGLAWDHLESDCEVLARQGWSALQIADELGIAVDEARTLMPEEDPNADAIAHAYGTGTEEGADE